MSRSPVRPGEITIGIILLLIFGFVIFGVGAVTDSITASLLNILEAIVIGAVLSLFLITGALTFNLVGQLYLRVRNNHSADLEKIEIDSEKNLLFRRKTDLIVGSSFACVLIMVAFLPGLITTPEKVVPRILLIAGGGGLIGLIIAVVAITYREVKMIRSRLH